jgi:hypothetical protein
LSYSPQQKDKQPNFGPNDQMMKGDSAPGIREPKGRVMEGQMRGLCTDQDLCSTNKRKLQRHLGMLGL